MNSTDIWETRTAKAYKLLFNAITDAIDYIDKGRFLMAREFLKFAQQQSEEFLIQD